MNIQWSNKMNTVIWDPRLKQAHHPEYKQDKTKLKTQISRNRVSCLAPRTSSRFCQLTVSRPRRNESTISRARQPSNTTPSLKKHTILYNITSIRDCTVNNNQRRWTRTQIEETFRRFHEFRVVALVKCWSSLRNQKANVVVQVFCWNMLYLNAACWSSVGNNGFAIA